MSNERNQKYKWSKTIEWVESTELAKQKKTTIK